MSTEKGRDAYRTIGEVAEELELPQHVLRFWETKFGHLRPMKRAGGRRFYRPADVALLKGIRRLLYEDGYTIRGVQRILREQGPRQVAALGRGEPDGAIAGEPRTAPPLRPAAGPPEGGEAAEPAAPSPRIDRAPARGSGAAGEAPGEESAPRGETAPPESDRRAAARYEEAPAPRTGPAGDAAPTAGEREGDARAPSPERTGASAEGEAGARRRGLPDDASREALQRVLSEILACKRILDESE